MSNLNLYLCKIRFDSKPKPNRNKIGTSSSWVKITLRTLRLDWKHYKYVCFDCHRYLNSCINKDEFINKLKLEELIGTESDGFQESLFQINPEVTTGSFCLDYASIEDKSKF